MGSVAARRRSVRTPGVGVTPTRPVVVGRRAIANYGRIWFTARSASTTGGCPRARDPRPGWPVAKDGRGCGTRPGGRGLKAAEGSGGGPSGRRGCAPATSGGCGITRPNGGCPFRGPGSAAGVSKEGGAIGRSKGLHGPSTSIRFGILLSN